MVAQLEVGENVELVAIASFVVNIGPLKMRAELQSQGVSYSSPWDPPTPGYPAQTSDCIS